MKILIVLVLLFALPGLGDPSLDQAIAAKKSKAEIVATIRKVARRWGIDERRFLAVAKCESGLDPNPPGRVHAGIFQHSRKYFRARARRSGYARAAITGVYGNSWVAAYLVKRGGGYGHWRFCARHWRRYA